MDVKSLNQALLEAAEKGDHKRLNNLILQGADIHYVDGGAFPLMHAAKLKNSRCVEILINAGAHVNQKTPSGYSALHAAASFGSIDNVELLVKHHADINAKDEDGDSPLLLAAMVGHIECVRFIVNHGGDINARNYTGDTSLQYSAWNCDYKDVLFLLNNGADVTLRNNRCDSPLELAKLSKKGDIFDLLKSYRDHKDENEVHHLASPLNRAFLEAAAKGQPRVFKKCLALGADMDGIDLYDDSAVVYAIRNNRLSMLEMLTQHGANFSISNDVGETTLHEAVNFGNTDCLLYLLRKSLDINCQDHGGRTPLHKAAYIGHINAVQALIESGCDVSIKNKAGHTALDIAIKEYQLDITDYLEKQKTKMVLLDLIDADQCLEPTYLTM